MSGDCMLFWNPRNLSPNHVGSSSGANAASRMAKSKIIFIVWSPDTSRVRSKMLYASSKDRFKRELDGIQVELQATDPTEMGLDVIRGRAN
ncbi:unnamed protein product [Musa acuminata subsp. malaccensis]|uniref:(wild Malaysian banana) hypothetical protein n=1 Tax=Musa acuminata subsp. malaccensis TaxID=214687 RepID=A0A804JH38_MUSAM|nr:unnamed protein product [Musa acuminata subsp. malaccensis]